MSILVDESIKVIVQGITGREATFHSALCMQYGTKIVAGVSPGKSGDKHLGINVYNTVKEATRATSAKTSLLFVPNFAAADAICEAADANIELAIVITEGVPMQDMIIAKAFANSKKMNIIGPNSPGIISPGKTKIGIMPANIFKEGSIGLVSRSGTLMYEFAMQIIKANFGISTALGIGGDQVIGLDFATVLNLFEKDPQTKAIVMIGEIGGLLEVEAIATIKHMSKPVIAYIAGQYSPKEKKMGHAGAIVSGYGESAKEKIEALSQACIVETNPLLITQKLTTLLL